MAQKIDKIEFIHVEGDGSMGLFTKKSKAALEFRKTLLGIEKETKESVAKTEELLNRPEIKEYIAALGKNSKSGNTK